MSLNRSTSTRCPTLPDRTRRRAFASAVIGLLLLSTTGPVRAEDPLDAVLGGIDTALPNLVPDVRHVEIKSQYVFDPLTLTSVPTGPRWLAFDTWAQNLGNVPVQLTVDRVDSLDSSTVSQCTAWRPERVCVEQRPVGGFTWHAEHRHFHFSEFARYELRRVLANGSIDYGRRGLVAASDKVSFCLYDAAPVRGDASVVPFYNTCTPTVQGISPGYADVYNPDMEGQTFPLDAISDGRYALVIDMDYADRLFETDDTDNVVEVMIEVYDNVTGAVVVGRNRPGGSG